MSDRSTDWIQQAERDLEAATATSSAGYHEWACFIFQQAGEKASKAVLQRMGAEAWGHSVSQLIRAVGEQYEVPGAVQEAARVLDRFYVPARYPNGYAAGKPGDYIVEEDARNASSSAQTIVQFCHGLLARS